MFNQAKVAKIEKCTCFIYTLTLYSNGRLILPKMFMYLTDIKQAWKFTTDWTISSPWLQLSTMRIWYNHGTTNSNPECNTQSIMPTLQPRIATCDHQQRSLISANFNKRQVFFPPTTSTIDIKLPLYAKINYIYLDQKENFHKILQQLEAKSPPRGIRSKRLKHEAHSSYLYEVKQMI